MNPGRRRFASTGAKASGVLLTLASSSGMAQTVCKSPSGFMSGNLSRHGNQTVTCAGLSPGYWKNWPDSWPPSCYAYKVAPHKATTFASVFPSGWTSLYQNGTMMDVLVNNDNGQDPYNLGAHMVAAYLNVKANKISFFTVDVLKAMWHDLATYNYYSPSAGIKWYAEDVAKYLTKTEG